MELREWALLIRRLFSQVREIELPLEAHEGMLRIYNANTRQFTLVTVQIFF
jgi:hypothetical protein